jgi:hypothetical protein
MEGRYVLSHRNVQRARRECRNANRARIMVRLPYGLLLLYGLKEWTDDMM